MNFEFKWGFALEFPWLEKVHDYVWPGEDEDDE
jgi:hypothetical protein